MGVTKLGDSISKMGYFKIYMNTRFFQTCKYFDSLNWLYQFKWCSKELEDAVKFAERIKQDFLGDYSRKEILKLIQSDNCGKEIIEGVNDCWYYLSFMASYLMDKLKYKQWNQYYYSNMSNEDLKNLIDIEFKKLINNAKLHELNSDFI